MDASSSTTEELSDTTIYLDEDRSTGRTAVVTEGVAQARPSRLLGRLLPVIATVLLASVVVLIYFAVRFVKEDTVFIEATRTTTEPSNDSYCYVRSLPAQSVPTTEKNLKHSFIKVEVRHQTALIVSEIVRRREWFRRRFKFFVSSSSNSPLMTTVVRTCNLTRQLIYRVLWKPIPDNDEAKWDADRLGSPTVSSFDTAALAPFLDALWNEDGVSKDSHLEGSKLKKKTALNMELRIFQASSNLSMFSGILQTSNESRAFMYELDWIMCYSDYDEDLTIGVFLSTESDAIVELRFITYCDFEIGF